MDCKDESHPSKPYKFNEILLCRMKSKRVWMKSSAYGFRWNQIRLLSPCVSGISSRSDFIHVSGFIPQKADLVKKDCNFVSKLQSFFGRSSREPSGTQWFSSYHSTKKGKQFLLTFFVNNQKFWYRFSSINWNLFVLFT